MDDESVFGKALKQTMWYDRIHNKEGDKDKGLGYWVDYYSIRDHIDKKAGSAELGLAMVEQVYDGDALTAAKKVYHLNDEEFEMLKLEVKLS